MENEGSMVSEKKPYKVLLIEDNPGDVRLTQEAFKEGDIAVDLDVVMDGVEAIEYLFKAEKYKDKPTPDLILLDLNLPKKDGREVLEKIKSDQGLESVPVIVLTTSNAEQDIIKCYELKANCFLNKPFDFDMFFEIIQRIKSFWLERPTTTTV